MEQTPSQPSTAEERAAARWNTTDGARRYGPAFAALGEAVGHLTLIRDPDLFHRSLVGRWPTMDSFVHDFVLEAELEEQLSAVPERLRPFVGIDRERVAANLRDELLVLEVTDGVWVFDAAPVVKTTVEET